MASEIPQSTIQQLAADVYEQCLQAPSAYLFSVHEIQEMTPGKTNIEVTSRVLNELLRMRQLQAMMQGTENVFKVVPRDVIEK